MRLLLAVFLFGIAGIVIFGCGDKGTELQEGDSSGNPATEPIQWVNTSVFYDSSATKEDYSLIIFGAPWCGYCRMLEELTLTDSTVVAIMNESFNCAKINIDADSMVAHFDSTVTCRQYAHAHEVSGIPATCILNRGGEMLINIGGFRGAHDYARILDTIRSGALGPPKRFVKWPASTRFGL
jgi:thioredoxin-related protein